MSLAYPEDDVPHSTDEESPGEMQATMKSYEDDFHESHRAVNKKTAAALRSHGMKRPSKRASSPRRTSRLRMCRSVQRGRTIHQVKLDGRALVQIQGPTDRWSTEAHMKRAVDMLFDCAKAMIDKLDFDKLKVELQALKAMPEFVLMLRS